MYQALDLQIASRAGNCVLQHLLLSLPEAVVKNTQHCIWLSNELRYDICVLVGQLSTVDLDTEVLLCIWAFKYASQLLQQCLVEGK